MMKKRIILLIMMIWLIILVLLWRRQKEKQLLVQPILQKEEDPVFHEVIKHYLFTRHDYDGGDERLFAIQKLIHLSCLLYKKPHLKNVPISTQDRGAGEYGVYTFCYPADRPDLSFYSGPDWCCYWWWSANIPNYLTLAHSLEQKGSTKPMTQKAGWVGNINSPLPDVPEHRTRPLLQEFAKQHPHLLESIHVSPVDAHVNTTVRNYRSLEQQVERYQYLIDIGGNGYSGRLKMIMWSGRPILLVQRRYIEYFYKDLIPYHHYIPVREDLSDLIEQIQWCRRNRAKTLEIGRNSQQFARKHFHLKTILESVHRTLLHCHQWKHIKK